MPSIRIDFQLIGSCEWIENWFSYIYWYNYAAAVNVLTTWHLPVNDSAGGSWADVDCVSDQLQNSPVRAAVVEESRNATGAAVFNFIDLPPGLRLRTFQSSAVFCRNSVVVKVIPPWRIFYGHRECLLRWRSVDSNHSNWVRLFITKVVPCR